jgi:PqqD family protein of HPr-rel-A system
MQLELSTIVCQDPAPLKATVDDEVMLMNTESGFYYGLNSVGSRIWERIAQPATVQEICATLLDEFDISPEQCQKECLHFLGMLLERGLIRIDNAPAA